jgi:hypothetical protein
MPDEVLASLNALTLRALAANGEAFRPALPPDQEFTARFFGDGLRRRVPQVADPTIAVTYEDDVVLVPLSVLTAWLHSDQAPGNIGMGVVGPDRELPAGADADIRFISRAHVLYGVYQPHRVFTHGFRANEVKWRPRTWRGTRRRPSNDGAG